MDIIGNPIKVKKEETPSEIARREAEAKKQAGGSKKDLPLTIQALARLDELAPGDEMEKRLPADEQSVTSKVIQDLQWTSRTKDGKWHKGGETPGGAKPRKLFTELGQSDADYSEMTPGGRKGGGSDSTPGRAPTVLAKARRRGSTAGSERGSDRGSATGRPRRGSAGGSERGGSAGGSQRGGSAGSGSRPKRKRPKKLKDEMERPGHKCLKREEIISVKEIEDNRKARTGAVGPTADPYQHTIR